MPRSAVPFDPRRRILLKLSGSAALMALPLLWRDALAALPEPSGKEVVAGLREALSRGAQAAVSQLSAHDGFFGDARVRIPLPTQIQQAEKMIRRFGLGRYVDGVSETLNRAAESAVGEATPLLLDSLKRMTLTDAKSILAGTDDAATQYFRRSAGDMLQVKFLPIVERATAQVALKPQYEKLSRRAARYGLVSEADADLDGWVTAKALDGLWLVLADQERAIRKDPVATGSVLLKKVFGSLGGTK